MVQRNPGEQEEVRVTQAGVVGFPARHSLSPVIHKAAYRELGLDWRYDAHEVESADFPGWFASLGPEWRGLSVTMPHKEAAARLGEPDADVALTGVANTVVWQDDGRLTVHNTDIAGFTGALDAAATPGFAEATVLGAGATARSALVALARWGVRKVTVSARRAAAATGLAEWATNLGVTATAGGWPPKGAGLIVSTVPAVGASTIADELDWDHIEALFDVSYYPWPTPLAAAALAAGVPVVSGLDLLVHQAWHQVELMTGQEVPIAVLESAARNELGRRRDA